jgi:hypothetical protein
MLMKAGAGDHRLLRDVRALHALMDRSMIAECSAAGGAQSRIGKKIVKASVSIGVQHSD